MSGEILQRNPTSTGNRRVFTWAAWIKFNTNSSTSNTIWYVASSGGSEFGISLVPTSNIISVLDYSASAYQYLYQTTRCIRDPSNWFHLIVAVDTTQFREDDRFKIYVNGVLYNGGYSTETTIGGINYQTRMNTPGEINTIGRNIAGGLNYNFNGQLSDLFMIDGQALTPDVFGFYKTGKGYISAGSTQSTDFRPGQWVPKTPRAIKTAINNNGGFGVNGFYLPMNDSKNFGADFHGDPNSIITLNEKLPQPRVGVATTATAGIGYTDALRVDPYAANLVLALPFVSGGLNSGFGDYAPSIKGSGSANNATSNSVSIASTASYYGNAAFFSGTGIYAYVAGGSNWDWWLQDYTVEYWYKENATFKTSINTDPVVVGLVQPTGGGNYWSFGPLNNGSVQFYYFNGSTQRVSSSAGIHTVGQWNHYAFTNKSGVLTLYLNGVSVGIATQISGTPQTSYAYNLNIGQANSNAITGYIQDLRIYKGVAKYTGGFDVPRPYTPVGIATWRAVPDTTANNFATMNPLIEARPSSGTNSPSNSTIVTFAGGNLDLTNSASAGNAQRMYSFATIGISTGRWYWEVRASSNDAVAITKGFQQLNYVGTLGNGSGLEASVSYSGGGSVSVANTAYYSTATTLTAPTYDTTNIIGVAINSNSGLNNLTVQWFKDGVGVATLTGVGATSPVLEWFPTRSVSSSGSGGDTKYNFGQNPTFSGNVSVAGTFTDTNGKGLFKYQPPSGFLALCEDNLPTPAIANPGKHFKTVLYTGDGNSGRSIVGVGFTPDLVWYKARSSAFGNGLFDSVRGTFRLSSDGTGAENTDQGVISFNSDGFSLGNHASGNTSGTTMVAWCWRAGAGTTSTNTNGSITSVVSVNQDAGFSIVSYTGTGSAATVGHGLGKVPKFIITKSRTTADDWFIYHSSVGNGSYVLLNSTAASTVSSTIWNNTSPTSTTFSLGTSGGANRLNDRLIAYCWAEIEGFSKFGSYVGNGSTDGPFVYCGFKPAFILYKRYDVGSGENWEIYDSSRQPTNPATMLLKANASDIEASYLTTGMDTLSNGFKIRDNATRINASGGTYIFAAFAESPFQTANAK
jgi:hypothetical protein